MIELSAVLTVAVAAFFLAIVPGPTVTVIIANSLRSGTRAGMWNVAGTFAGDAVMIVILAFGLQAILSFVGEAFFWIKLLGGAYLIWVGISLLRSDGSFGADSGSREPKIGYFWQGFVVVITNPKALFFLGAFIPQFIDPAGDTFWQTVILGLTFAIVASLSDMIYAILAGKAGRWMTQSNVRKGEIISGLFLIGGGIWLALARRASA